MHWPSRFPKRYKKNVIHEYLCRTEGSLMFLADYSKIY